MMKEGKGIGCGEDDDGIYFTVDEAHWSAGNDDQSGLVTNSVILFSRGSLQILWGFLTAAQLRSVVF